MSKINDIKIIDLKDHICNKKIVFIDKNEFIISELETIKYNKEKKKLDILENKLTKLLSEEKKVELEIKEIESMLN